AGAMSTPQFRRQERDFKISEQEFSPENEDAEISKIEKESAHTLKLILRQLLIQEKLDRERRQRDGSEHEEGSIGAIQQENRELRRKQAQTTDSGESQIIQSQIDSNNSRINAMRRGGEEEEQQGGGGRFGASFNQTAMSVARGDLSGTVMGGAQMARSMGSLAKGLTITGLVAMVIKEFMGHGEKIQEAIGGTSSMRGGRSSGTAYNQQLQSIISSTDILGNLGLSGDEFAGMVNQKAKASTMAGNNVVGRTMDDFAFEKGFGADVGIFSEFERFNENQSTATSIGLDVLNVLTSIEKSSLKENNLSTLAEKLQAQQTIMSVQIGKRDMTDTDSALRILSAFEGIGLSEKAGGGSDFLSRTLGGVGEGGGDNQMLLKYEAAKRTRPELANDPAGLKRFIKFHSDDPAYMKEFGNLMGEISGGSQMAMDDIIYSMFDPKSETDMKLYEKWFQGDSDMNDTLTGKNPLDKTRKSSLDKGTMYDDAQSSVGQITTMMKDFSNTMQEMLVNFKAFTANPVRAMITNLPTQTNTTRPGR
ncbi:MAG: hypothetical protein ABIN48_01940, partial [Ginsengibacter sp.]